VQVAPGDMTVQAPTDLTSSAVASGPVWRLEELVSGGGVAVVVTVELSTNLEAETLTEARTERAARVASTQGQCLACGSVEHDTEGHDGAWVDLDTIEERLGLAPLPDPSGGEPSRSRPRLGSASRSQSAADLVAVLDQITDLYGPSLEAIPDPGVRARALLIRSRLAGAVRTDR
jgi:hypothetical protein